MKSKNYRSPLFYMGDKFKLLDQLKNKFPKNINDFIEPFTGGGSVFLNIKANNYYLNEKLYIGCSKGALIVNKIQFQNKKVISSKDFSNITNLRNINFE